MPIDHADVITSGGATAFLNLVLYLLERFGGRERASLAAKVLLVDGHRQSQLPYVAALPGRFHDDLLVHAIQQHIDRHLEERLQVGQLASQFGLSSRTLTRRFALATGDGHRSMYGTRAFSTASVCSRRRATRSMRFVVMPRTTIRQHFDACSSRPPA
jgi:transcriptional regulator GlxA family with amidase domain